MLVVDFKYVHKGIYSTPELNRKALSDVKKQLVYEAAILLNGLAKTVASQFCLPKFYSVVSDGVGSPVPTTELNLLLRQRGISVLEADFEQVKNAYLMVE